MRGRKVAASEKWEMGTRIRSEISSCACIIGRRNAPRRAEADETAIFHGRGRRKPETGLAEHAERSCSTRTIVYRTREKIADLRDRKWLDSSLLCIFFFLLSLCCHSSFLIMPLSGKIRIIKTSWIKTCVKQVSFLIKIKSSEGIDTKNARVISKNCYYYMIVWLLEFWMIFLNRRKSN